MNTIVKNKTKDPRLDGQTSHILPEERARASFDSKAMASFFYGGEAGLKKKKFLESVISEDPKEALDLYNYDRDEHFAHGIKTFIGYHKPYAGYRPTRADITYMAEIGIGYGALNNSHGIFMTTITGQGTDEQANFWRPKVLKFEVTGSYAQTELGHGSNVRGLQTIAEFDQKTDEFVLNTPTLTATKWWPGCLGKASTHVVLYAQLILEGKEKGVCVFIVQIRDENHLPLPGVRCGDLGNKIGDNANDTGFLQLENVRIPRVNMLMKYRTVSRDGKFEEVGNVDPKVHYYTMMATRAMMVNTAGGRICQAATIAVRYSCVRKQGFESSKSSISYQSPEVKIIDHKIQQYRLMRGLANGYAFKLVGRWMIKLFSEFEGSYGVIKKTDGLKEMASTSAGLKSLSSYLATLYIEDMRKSCGGNGYLLNSGIAALGNDYLWQVTAEGDFIILGLLTARFLYNSVKEVLSEKKLESVVEYLNILSSVHPSKLHPGDASSTADFLKIDYLRRLFEFRALTRVHDAYHLVTDSIKAGKSFDESWTLHQNESLAASFAHCHLIVINNFINQIAEADESLKKVLTRVCIVYALTNINDENWGDIISCNQFKLVREACYQTMAELRPDSVALVDSFEYPDKILKSTIGRYDGNVYEALFEAAEKSRLNRVDPYEGYQESFDKHLNKEFLKHANKPVLKAKF